jgi:hypothetical protein
MRYKVWLLREDGTPSMTPSPITANGIAAAQRQAQATLEELQREGALIGWSIKTVTESV